MTFKLTEKDIEAIEAAVNAYLDSGEKSSQADANMVRGIRLCGVNVPRKKWPEQSRKQAGITNSINTKSRWAALREFEAREAAR